MLTVLFLLVAGITAFILLLLFNPEICNITFSRNCQRMSSARVFVKEFGKFQTPWTYLI